MKAVEDVSGWDAKEPCGSEVDIAFSVEEEMGAERAGTRGG